MYIHNIHNICGDIFQEFCVNLLFFAKKLVLLSFLLSLDKILRFFGVVIYIYIYICFQYRINEPIIFFRKLGQFTSLFFAKKLVFINNSLTARPST